jgi:thiosulfate/3-mercaptopyruvate sulfurtransferase
MSNHNIFYSHEHEGGKNCLSRVVIVSLALVIAIVLSVSGVYAGECKACKGEENWDPMAFLNSDVTAPSGSSGATSSSASSQQAARPPDLSFRGQTLVPLSSIESSDLVLDVSDRDSYDMSHVKGAVNVPFSSFFDANGSLKSNQELSSILGTASISRDDSVLVYGGDLSSGEAAFTFWLLSYLGQNNVKLLDGGLKDYTAASLPLESGRNDIPPVEYLPSVNSQLLADYNYVNGGTAQIVDARTFQEFGRGRIPTAISIESTKVMDGSRLKANANLNDTFSMLTRSKPVVIYSDGGVEASLLWYALRTVGYDSRLYNWEDWQAHVSASASPVKVEDEKASHYTRLG